LLFVGYGGRRELVEPYIHGWTSEGTEVFMCFQREGESSPARGSWRTFQMARVERLEVTDIVFPFNQADFKPSPRGVRWVHCAVDQPL